MILGIDANIQHALMCARKDIEERKSWMERDYLKLKEASKKEGGISEEWIASTRGVIQGLEWAIEDIDRISLSRSYRID